MDAPARYTECFLRKKGLEKKREALEKDLLKYEKNMYETEKTRLELAVKEAKEALEAHENKFMIEKQKLLADNEDYRSVTKLHRECIQELERNASSTLDFLRKNREFRDPNLRARLTLRVVRDRIKSYTKGNVTKTLVRTRIFEDDDAVNKWFKENYYEEKEEMAVESLDED